MGTVYIVATPIGNLSDITLRAQEVLGSVDIVLCEDTRVTKKLLSHYNISTQTVSYHQHSTTQKKNQVLSYIEDGKNVALVTDAGTPGISDPGNELISYLTERVDVQIVPVPGVSAVITALSISGFPTDSFTFLGFPPHKKGRQTFFASLQEIRETVVFYESCHRIEKALALLAEVLPQDRRICVCRELTKKFESVYRGTAKELLAMDIPNKGEFVIVINRI